MIISQAKNLGIDPDIIKLMVGKSVKKDILTYMTGIDVKTVFSKLLEILGIKAFTEESENIVEAMGTNIKGLENAMNQLEKEGMNFKTRIDLLQKSQRENVERLGDLKKENKRINELLELLYPKQVIRHILDRDNKVVSWEEDFETPDEYIESEREFRRMTLKALNKQKDKEFQEYIKSKHPQIEELREHINGIQKRE